MNCVFKKQVTLDSIIKGFTETINDLETLITRLGSDVVNHEVEIDRLQYEINAKRDERESAQQILNNLKNLINKD